MVRPEYASPPDIFYNELEAKKYVRNSRIRDIQTQMTERALELLLLPDEPCLLLDVGCGSGISGLTLNDASHFWIGIDISIHMIKAGLENEADKGGDMLLADMGKLMRFQDCIFDGVVSISALQWWLYMCLKKGSRAVFQFYPDSPEQIQTLTDCALRSGFGGGVVVDFPNSTKSKKYYLCLWAGSPIIPKLPDAVNVLENEQQDTIRRDTTRYNKKTKKVIEKRKDYILRKKEKRRRRGLEVPKDTKYTGKRRKPKF